MELSASIRMPDVGARRRLDSEHGCLVGARCAECGAVSWPSRAICHCCGLPAMAETAFDPHGSLLTHTTVWVGRPGLEPPYVLGQVKLVDGPLVFAHVRALPADARVPLPVRLVLSEEGAAVPPFWFEPEARA